jgi:hypothetical protein
MGIRFVFLRGEWFEVKKLNSKSHETAEAIGRHEAFQTHGALRAERRDGYGFSSWDSGLLQGEDLEKFREEVHDIVYVVFSYATPIAWVKADGETYKVKQKFSMTTSQHQGKLYLL